MKTSHTKTYWLLVGLLVFFVALSCWLYFKNVQKSEATAFDEINVQYAELSSRSDLTVATFSGGCFWCMEGPFESMDGVKEVVAGFAGGSAERPTYKQVVTGNTGHRESVQVFYDPTVVTFDELLTQYWTQIDPTDPGGQFADRGEHYTTAIFYHDDAQKLAAEKQIADLNKSGKYKKPIVTAVVAFTNFYPAEDYHQDYYIKSSRAYENYKEGSGRADYIESNKRLESQSGVNGSDTASQPKSGTITQPTNGTSDGTSPAAETTRYISYSPQSFAAASDKRRVIFFHAIWCPSCKVANTDFTENSNQIPSDVLVFKTDYDFEKDLKKKYGITYQHTFVQIDADGNAVTKWNGGATEKLLQSLK